MSVNWRRISIILLFALAISCLMLGYIYTISLQKHTPVNVTYKSISGDPTEHEQVYEVMVFPGVDQERVERALLLAPNAFGYTIVPVDESRFFYTDPEYWPNSGGEPFPNWGETYLILVVDSDQYPNAKYAGWTTNEHTGKIVIICRDNWPDMILSDVITHECAHNLEHNENLLDNYTKYSGDFISWLKEQWYWDGTDGINKTGMTRLYNDWAISELLEQSQVLSDAYTPTQTTSSSV